MAWLDIFTGEDSESDQRILDDTDRRLAALNAAKAEQIAKDDRLAAERYLAETDENLRRGRIADVEASVEAAFGEGFNEGAANIRGTIGNTLGGALSLPFKIVPWWILLGGAAFAFFWFFGLPKFLKAR